MTVPSAVARRIEDITLHGGIPAREVAQLLDTTSQTVSRWRNNKSRPHPPVLNRLLVLHFIAEQLSRVYEPGEARLWIFSPNIQLGGERPADKIQRGETDDVLALIDQLDTGAFL